MSETFVIGEMRSLISLQRAVVTRGPGGGEEVAWNEIAQVWAYIEPQRPSEFFRAHDLESARRTLLTIRARDDLPEWLRVVWQDRILRVVWVENLHQANHYQRLHCEEENR